VSMDAKDTKLRETWDQLVLLLIALPREGWKHEFRQITRKEVHWLAPPEESAAGHDE
jgi:hypothetical protein